MSAGAALCTSHTHTHTHLTHTVSLSLSLPALVKIDYRVILQHQPVSMVARRRLIGLGSLLRRCVCVCGASGDEDEDDDVDNDEDATLQYAL